MERVCVFAGSSEGEGKAYRRAARRLGETIAERGYGLVYGGARVGLMGLVADAALDAGGEAIGVIPQALVDKEVAHMGLSELRVVDSMHERKRCMSELADSFVALPGGFGTIDELFEILTWGQLGLHAKPAGLLDARGYYAHLLGFLDHAVGEGFLSARHRSMICVETEPPGLLDALEAYEAPKGPKWLDRTQT